MPCSGCWALYGMHPNFKKKLRIDWTGEGHKILKSEKPAVKSTETRHKKNHSVR